MELVKKGNIEYYVFNNLKGVKHCFSTRKGGVSEGCYESMNLVWREDKAENVIENYRLICNAIGCDSHNTVWTRQIHTDRIINVTEADRGKGLFRDRELEGYDGVITNCKDVVLTGFSADCVLVYFYDPVKKVIGICHSGWRGTVLAIGAKTVAKMEKDYGCNTNDIICGIAPAIGKCCFQVDQPVVDAFRKSFDWADNFIEIDKENEGHYYVDLHGVNEEILVRAGILRENIENSRICTMCHPDKFYSHRIMGNERGSMAGFISL